MRRPRTTPSYHSAAIVALNVTGLDKPLTVASAHLHPHSADARLIEVSVFHMKTDAGQFTVLAADANGIGLADPEPDWTLTRPGNRASRCVSAPPGTPPRGDRRVAWNLATAGFMDACQGPTYEATGSHIRVDQAYLSEALAPTLSGYRVVDHGDLSDFPEQRGEPLSDHKAIIVDLDLSKIDGCTSETAS